METAVYEEGLPFSSRTAQSRASSRVELHEPLLELGQIRVLTLYPGEPSTTLVCSLERQQIDDDSKPYEAFSYVWGQSKCSVPVICDGHLVDVTQNLHDALQVFRFRDGPRRIWADAICINQVDNDEKSRQVQWMGEIYKSAKQVLIWAGADQDSHADAVFSLLRQLAHHQSNSISTSRSAVPNLEEFLNTAAALRIFYGLPWFHRLWVIQEVVLSSSAVFRWGTSEISWNVIVDATQRILTEQQYSSNVSSIVGVHKTNFMWRLSTNPQQTRVSFRHLLRMGRLCETSEPRDKFYGLLSLPNTDILPSDDWQGRRPDYSKPVSDVYRDLTRRLIAVEGSLEPLGDVYHGSDIEGGVSSWVPRWDRKYDGGLVILRQRRWMNQFNGGLPGHTDTAMPDHPNSLLVRGLHIDGISSYSSPLVEERFTASEGKPVHADWWLITLQAFLGSHVTEHQLLQLAWTLSAGTD